MVVAGPEGEQAPAPQVEPEPDRPAGDAGQIARVLPPHSLARLVAADRQAGLKAKGLDPGIVCIEDLNAERAVWSIWNARVDEQVRSLKSDWARDELPAVGAGVHRGETVAAQKRDVHATAGVHVTVPIDSHARVPAVIEIEPVADYDTSPAGGSDIPAVPLSLTLGGADEDGAVGTAPVEAVAAIAELELGQLREAACEALAVVRTVVNGKHPQHEALVGDDGDAVQLRLVADGVVRLIELVGACPEDLVVVAESGQPKKTRILQIATGTAVTSRPTADTQTPAPSVRIVEQVRVITYVGLQLRALLPVNTVGRGVEPAAIVERLRSRAEISRVCRRKEKRLVALRLVGGRCIDPGREAVAVAPRRVDKHRIRAVNDIKLGPLPVQAVRAVGQRRVRATARRVPHLESPVRLVVEHAVVERTRHRWAVAGRVSIPRPGLLQLGVRMKNGIAAVLLRAVERTP